MQNSRSTSSGADEHGRDRLSGIKPLIFLSPEVLFELSDRQERAENRAIIEPVESLQKPTTFEAGAELKMYTTAATSVESDAYIVLEQDGITLLISKYIKLTPQQQVNAELKRGWIKNKLFAYISEKQQVPGFMGTRDCR